MLGAANRDAERSNKPTDDGRERNQLRSSLNSGHAATASACRFGANNGHRRSSLDHLVSEHRRRRKKSTSGRHPRSILAGQSSLAVFADGRRAWPVAPDVLLSEPGSLTSFSAREFALATAALGAFPKDFLRFSFAGIRVLRCIELDVSRQRSRPIKLDFTKLNSP
jgi:hypothetical protein